MLQHYLDVLRKRRARQTNDCVIDGAKNADVDVGKEVAGCESDECVSQHKVSNGDESATDATTDNGYGSLEERRTPSTLVNGDTTDTDDGSSSSDEHLDQIDSKDNDTSTLEVSIIVYYLLRAIHVADDKL